MMDEAALKSWVESALGGRIREWGVQDGGRSRAIIKTRVARGDELLDLIVRQDIESGPQFGTPFTMQREASALRALERCGVKLPKVWAIAPRGDALIMDRLAGTATLPADAAVRKRLIVSFAEQLAALHALEPNRLELPVPPALLARDGALNDLNDWQTSYRTLCVPHALIDEGFEWLYANAPDRGATARVVHGDAGPGNFLHENGAVTGLVDWEFTHIGDPHEDLAWLWFRVNMIKQDVEAKTYFDEYLRCSKLDFDAQRCIYYIAQTIMRCTVACGVRQAHDPTHDDTRPAQLRDMLSLALADARERRLHRLPALPV